MLAQAEWLLAALTREVTLFAAIGLLVGGIDDLVVDLIWLGRTLKRRLTIYRRHPRMTGETLPPPEHPGRIAIFIACWKEQDVIRDTLLHALKTLKHDDYRIYVGTYRNDPKTVAEVRAVTDPRIRLVGSAIDGPTTKAECLNRVWRAMLADERNAMGPFKAIVLHDAEDRVHADELRLFDRLIERFAFVQIPVMPTVRAGSPWVSGHYVEEFLEAHARQMVVREAIGADIPSAGVGTAISRRVMGRIARDSGGEPFDPTSITEDYEIGARLRRMGVPAAFVWMPERRGGPPIAVRAEFPHIFKEAVKQKVRWTLGIALAGWDRLRWDGGLSQRWMRLRDRRTVLAALLIAAGYLCLGLLVLCRVLGIEIQWPGPFWFVIALNLAMLIWRMALRAALVTRYYGLFQGLITIPRLLVGNAIGIVAAWRAISSYMPGTTPPWEKTVHYRPDRA